jgi:H+/Cl- antiporter ClcA
MPDVRQIAAFVRFALRWLLLAGAAGLLAGVASAVFLLTLSWATMTRLAAPALVLLLPAAGFLIGWAYHRFGGAAGAGSSLVIETLHSPDAGRIPLRMAPMVLAGTIMAHLFGASVGREGTAVQMGASLADGLRRLLRLSEADRRLLIMAGISGGFGSVFGTPIAGMVFGMEVQSIGRVRYEGVIPCLIAACVGEVVASGLGVTHVQRAALPQTGIDPLLLLAVAFGGVLFGLVAALFIELTERVRALLTHYIAFPPLRPLIGGLITVCLVLLLNTTDYLGLSEPLIARSLDGDIEPLAFLLKLIFTAVAIGSGFIGGEVTPLFVMGAASGCALGGLLGVDPGFMAAIGFVSVFAGASNTPIACALMGVELFGGGAALYLIVGCFTAYTASGHRSIYGAQRIGSLKIPGEPFPPNARVREWHTHKLHSSDDKPIST